MSFNKNIRHKILANSKCHIKRLYKEGEINTIYPQPTPTTL